MAWFQPKHGILKWVVQRINGSASAVESPVGWLRRIEDIDWRGIENSNRETFDKTMSIDRELWKKELLSHEEFFERIYDKLPKNFSL